MEILFHRYGSICEPDIIEVFERLEFSVIEDDTEIYQKIINPEARIDRTVELILTHSVSFVFSINYFPYISEICEKLHVLYLCLSVDCPVLELFSSSIRNSCNRIFLFDYNQYLQLKDENPACIFYLPLGTNVERWNQITLTEGDKSGQWQYDVSFVGSLYTEKSPYSKMKLNDFDRGYSDGLIESQMHLPGLSLLEEALPASLGQTLAVAAPSPLTLPDAIIDTTPYVAANYILGMRVSELERIRTLNAIASEFDIHLFTRSNTSALCNVHCHPGVSTHEEMPVVFNQSRINLNITMRSIQTGLSQRVWDIMGCQGFLLSNFQSEIPNYLEIGKDLDCFENTAELKEKIRFYLSHDEIRQEIAMHGYETVKSRHTYFHRIINMLNIVFPKQ